MKEYPILFQGDMVRAKMEGRKNQTRRLTGLNDINLEPDKWRYETSYINESGDLIDIFHHLPTNMFTDLKCPYGAPGSILWTRETFCAYQTVNYVTRAGGRSFSEISDGCYGFKADGHETIQDFKQYIKLMSGCDLETIEVKDNKWKPSIHMPKRACRIYSQNTGVRIQRLQDISEEDAIAEGVMPNCTTTPEHCPSIKCHKGGCQSAGEYIHYLRDYDDFPAHSAKESFQSLITKIHGPDIWEQNPWVRAISFRVLSTTGRPENLEELCAAL